MSRTNASSDPAAETPGIAVIHHRPALMIRFVGPGFAWALAFQGTTVMTVHLIIGAAVATLAAIELWMMSQIPPRLTTGR